MTTLPTDKSIRKVMPMKEGLLDYFPRALAYVSHVSFVGNEQHNPGEPLHWSKEKSSDHGSTIIRHLSESGAKDPDDLVLHSGKLAWRALALLEIELEKLSPEEFTNLVKASTERLKKPTPAPSASKYDGDWNYPAQTPDFWRVKGRTVHFIEDGIVKPSQYSFDWIKTNVDTGGLVKNTWSL